MKINREDVFIRVVYGFGGRLVGSSGLMDFCDHLTDMGFIVSDDILWNRPEAIAEDLDRCSFSRKVVIGFSMGANCLTWISNIVEKPIHLGVAYDPSFVLPFMKPLDEVSNKIEKCLHYRGSGFPVGGAMIYGPTVETVNAGRWHFGMDYDQGLHQKTMLEISRIRGLDD